MNPLQVIENPGPLCQSCMPWTLPFAIKARPSMMRSGEVIPIHVVIHQRGVPLS